MAREKGSVRIGPVSVFALVVILGLAVLAVLSAATAQASHTEAQAQADFTRSAYVNDAAAAQALADIDAALADAALAQEAVMQTEGSASNDASRGASTVDVAGGDNALANSASTGAARGAETGSAADSDAIVGASASGATTLSYNMESAMSAVSAVLPQGQVSDGCVAESSVDGTVVRMTFSTEDGRTLDVELAVRDDLTYSLERWSVTTKWNQEPEETKLWQGSDSG